MTNNQVLILSSNDLALLAQLTGADQLFGFPKEFLHTDTKDSKDSELKLLKQGVIDKDDDGLTLSPEYLPLITGIFRPERVFEIIKDTVGKGKQRVIFISSAGKLILHVQPEEGVHSLKLLDRDQISSLIAEWFKDIPEGSVEAFTMSILESQFDEIRVLCETNQREKAIQTLEQIGTPRPQAETIFSQIKNRRVSSVFAFYEFTDAIATEVSSFSFFAGDSSTWLILEDGDADKVKVSSRPNLFEITVNEFKEKFLMNKEALFRSFVLTKNMLAVSLNLINQTQLGLQLLKGKGQTATYLELEEVYEDTVAEMNKLGLLMQPPNSPVPHLLPTFELAFSPIVVCNELVIARLARTGFGADARIFCSRDKSFSSLLENNDRYVLETGRYENLPIYLLELFKGFHPVEEPGDMKDFTIPYQSLIEVIGGGRSVKRVSEQLTAWIEDAPTREALSSDIVGTVFRGSIQKMDYPVITDDDATQNTKKPILMLLQGKRYSWLFKYEDEISTFPGTGQLVTREQFATKLTDFFK